MTDLHKLPLAVVAILCGAAWWNPGNLSAENWPGWRGPERNGISPEKNLPTHWSAEQNVLWKQPVVGSGISNPIVWGDRVIVTASDGPRHDNLHAICYSLADGRELWHQQFWGTAPTRHHGTKSDMASPAPVTDGEHIFAFYGTGDVFSLEMDGDLVWQRSLAGEYGVFENRFAATSSPILFRDSVILQCDHYGDSYAVALDKRTGANRWKTDRPECWLSWSSPQLVETDAGKMELLLSGSHKLDALDPQNGSQLWTIPEMQRECIPTPVIGNGLIYAVSGPGGPSLAIRPGGRGDVSASHVVWRNPRGAPFVPSAILVGWHYYLIGDDGIATCLNADDGSVIWQKRMRGKFTASPVAADGKIYFCDEAGTTVVIEAESDKYKELARNELGEPIYASPAISQGRIIIRTTKHLFCIGEPTR